ncbi:alpha/beta fold hydrolase [Granulicoccus sp. GXG6511]|uniref:alpha/beta fold hydrolase n=1 Tax=Granulicoccus sp. GXG6511 TaxID=3381351 RepID=UPI003D7D8AA9
MTKKSTIVPMLTQHALHLTTRSLEAVHPELSAAIAARLWFHVGRPPTAAVRNRHATPKGTPFSVALHGKPVHGMQWGDPAAPLAYLVHGWGGWWQQLSSFAPLLLGLGYQVVAFDALAHGDSGPGAFGRRSSSVPEMAESYQAVADRFGQPTATVAHSMGCLSVLWTQRHHGVVPQRQVLIAPAASTRGMVDVFAQAVGIGKPTLTPLARRFRSRMHRPLSDFDLLPLVAAERLLRQLPPALIVHDHDDRMTSPAESELLAQQWPGSELLLTTGHGHYRVLRSSETLAAVVGILAEVTA